MGLELLVFSQSGVICCDEGVHILASQLILWKKTPYENFFYQHPPNYIYLNALWLSLFGHTWRAAHVLSAICSALAVFIATKCADLLLPESSWKRMSLLFTSVLLGTSSLFLFAGTVATPYGLAILLSLLAFYSVLKSSSAEANHFDFLVGFSAAGALGASLLTAPVGLMLVVMNLLKGERSFWKNKLSKMSLGLLIGSLPSIYFLLTATKIFLTDVVVYHIFYKGTLGAKATVAILTSWLSSPHDVLLAILAALGLACSGLRRQSDFVRRKLIYFCAGITAALLIFISMTRALYFAYYVIALPFLAILAAAGAHTIGVRLFPSAKRKWPLLVALTVAVCYDPASFISFSFLNHHKEDWHSVDEIAAAINRLVTNEGQIYIDFPEVYFVSKKQPLKGLENPYACMLPEPHASEVGAISRSRLQNLLQQSKFAAVLIPKERQDPEADLKPLYQVAGQADGFIIWLRQ